MRAILQRVKNAAVTVDQKKISEIGTGLLILLGIEHEDHKEDAEWLSRKICNLRIFPDDKGMNLSIKDVQGEILIVSQFTLHASTKKGNRPSFIKAARPEQAEELYKTFISLCNQEISGKIQQGKFGAMMDVNLLNWGPVTIIIDTKNKE